MVINCTYCKARHISSLTKTISNSFHSSFTRLNSGENERRKALMAKGLPKRRELQGVTRTVLVASGKGGVGKSTTAVNVAAAMSNRKYNKSIGLLDADIYGPSIPIMMNLSGQPFLDKNNKMIPLTNYNIK